MGNSVCVQQKKHGIASKEPYAFAELAIDVQMPALINERIN
jgi:hypothetical protein